MKFSLIAKTINQYPPHQYPLWHHAGEGLFYCLCLINKFNIKKRFQYPDEYLFILRSGSEI